ncbi:MAG: protein phosphatase 2C domain-containing protein, partial [Myxococcales bacterium]|nr:protein phosphatase 2C domain-containing protein [Myxococcales bacterium]
MRRTATVRPSAGTRLGAWVVREARGEPDPVGVGPDGVEVTLALGRERALAVERAALEALADRTDMPKVLDVGEDPTIGAFLALSRPSVDGHGLSLLLALESALAVAFAVEQAGFTFTPRAGDFAWGSRLEMRRLRGAMKLPQGERIDARSIVESVGSALAGRLRPLLVPPALLHLVLPHSQRNRDLARHPEAVRADLVRVAPFSPLPGEDAPRAAYVCDIGLHRERNEDAAAIEVHGEWTLVAVADGVSAATRAEIASRLAVERCLASLRAAEQIDAQSMTDAIMDAHHALCDEPAVAAGETLGTTL